MILIVEETATRHGRFDGWIGNRQIVHASRTPFLRAARVLVSEGVDPTTVLVMRHRNTGTESLRGPIGKAATLQVAETVGAPRFERFNPDKIKRWHTRRDSTTSTGPSPPSTSPQFQMPDQPPQQKIARTGEDPILPDGPKGLPIAPSNHIAGVTGPAPA